MLDNGRREKEQEKKMGVPPEGTIRTRIAFQSRRNSILIPSYPVRDPYCWRGEFRGECVFVDGAVRGEVELVVSWS